jgi:Tfp pilus assembly protein PilF
LKVIRRSAWMAITLLSVVLLSGCASSPRSTSNDELPTTSDRTDNQRRASIRLQLAVGYYQQGQWQTALDEAKQAIQIDPNLTDAYTMAALTYTELGQTRLAEEHYQRAMTLAPNDPDLNNNYGWFLCQNGRPEKSIAYFDTAASNKSYQSPAKALANAGQYRDEYRFGTYQLRSWRFSERAFLRQPIGERERSDGRSVVAGSQDRAQAGQPHGGKQSGDAVAPSLS